MAWSAKSRPEFESNSGTYLRCVFLVLCASMIGATTSEGLLVTARSHIQFFGLDAAA